MDTPKTLQGSYHFLLRIADNCIAYMVEARWPDGVVGMPHLRTGWERHGW